MSISFNLHKKQTNNPLNVSTNNNFDLEKNPQLREIPVKNVILFTNARDEKHIKEWAAHHILIGFNYVYIFDHKSIVPLNEVFKNFDKRVIVERCEINEAPKFTLMKKASIIASKMGADWFIYLDADEFIILNRYRGVKEMLNKYKFADSLSLNWVMFGSNNHVSEPEGLILDNYTKSDPFFNDHVKTFVRPSQISGIVPSSPHLYPMTNPSKMFAITGEPMANKIFNSTEKTFTQAPAFIAHFIYQSEETYKKRKIDLPRDDANSYREEDTDIHSNHNDFENLIPKKYSSLVAAFLQQFE